MAVKLIPKQEILEMLLEIEASIDMLETSLDKSVERERNLIMYNREDVAEGYQLKMKKARVSSEPINGSQKLPNLGKRISIEPKLSY
ncbi:hypothetical protein D0469_12020 [Peribacillus saganii]|uniref:Uncharacterized protein n=1 Tax=Peribacillus saganii TaxID=2303992 RepID=A0A372LMV4_9BACI|nr:hypothetical protein [Peribacillus saganii]RFU68458.1 hypothetical protein D0469_12020 [Peribacillus saganii]